MEDPKYVLSILSYVSHGYVGNRSVVFPLQYYGWDVDTINTTDFLNHPGYGTFKGKKTDPDQIAELFKGLANIMPSIGEYKMILVGYCPGGAILDAVYRQLEPMVANGRETPALIIDPVLGDNGKLYVPEEIIPIHKRFLKLGLVSLITPNQFELEVLSETSVTDWDSLMLALRRMHENYGLPNIIVSSVVIHGKMFCVGYRRTGPAKKEECFYLPIEEIKCKFNGCGDVFAALAIHAFYCNGLSLTPYVLNFAMAKMTKILQVSYDAQKKLTGEPPTNVLDVRVVTLRHVLLEDVVPVKVGYL